MLDAKSGIHGLRSFKLRSKDEFKNLEELARKIRLILEEHNPAPIPTPTQVEGAPVVALKAASGDGTTDRS